MKIFFAIVLFVIFALAFRAKWKQPNKMVRSLKLIRRDNEVARSISLEPQTSVAAATPRLPAPQSRSSGGMHAPFLNPANHRQLPKRVRHTCDCAERGPRDINRVHANVICINCRGSLPAKLAG